MQVLCNGYFYADEKVSISHAVNVFNQHFNISEHFYFTLNSVTRDKISELNSKHFNKSGPTDVLSFPLFESFDAISKLNPENEESLGDMFFCRPVLKKNAVHYSKHLIDELQLVLVHGLLHLVGYSHIDEKKLREKENEILDKVWNESRG